MNEKNEETGLVWGSSEWLMHKVDAERTKIFIREHMIMAVRVNKEIRVRFPKSAFMARLSSGDIDEIKRAVFFVSTFNIYCRAGDPDGLEYFAVIGEKQAGPVERAKPW